MLQHELTAGLIGLAHPCSKNQFQCSEPPVAVVLLTDVEHFGGFFMDPFG